MMKLSKLIVTSVLAISLLAPVSAYAHGGGKFGGPGKGFKPVKPGHHQHMKAPLAPATTAPATASDPAVSSPSAKPAPKYHGKYVPGMYHKHHPKGPAPHLKGKKPPVSPKGFAGKGFASVQKATFFTLLVEKYSPDTLSSWQTTLADAQKLRADIQAIVKANPELKTTLKTLHTEDLKAKMEEHKATRDAFNAALTAKDGEKIKASLASILTKLQDRNKLLTTKLADLQKAVAAKATPAPTPDAPITP